MAGIVGSLKRLRRQSTVKDDHAILGQAIAEIESLTTQRDALLTAYRAVKTARDDCHNFADLNRRLDQIMAAFSAAVALCPAPPAVVEACEPKPKST